MNPRPFARSRQQQAECARAAKRLKPPDRRSGRACSGCCCCRCRKRSTQVAARRPCDRMVLPNVAGSLLLALAAASVLACQTATCRQSRAYSTATTGEQQQEEEFNNNSNNIPSGLYAAPNHHHPRAYIHKQDHNKLAAAVAESAAGANISSNSRSNSSEIIRLTAATSGHQRRAQQDTTISGKQLAAAAGAAASTSGAFSMASSAAALTLAAAGGEPSAAAANLSPPPAAASAGPAGNEDNMKFPLYMRILATLACLIIFTIGVCGNLLVPLVVIKTKYLRNSTNLFLINLSVADLLVLIVCMPTVLIELHSRPETWLLGEPMCKLSNFVEMLAANGSIFTILAISFERYYAICKPLKAGYKCTRLRATIIICIIWVLSTILTSPILIMAKSSETIYIDGSLVYNCILETDTYWHKTYVFVSMIAFFCLPLIVLMLVYWLIGRRLIRENLAMSTTTTAAAAATDSQVSQQQAHCCCRAHLAADGAGERHPGGEHCGHCHLHGPDNSAIYAVRKRVGGLKKAASFKSISSSLFSLLQHQSYHQISHHNQQQQQQHKQADAYSCAAKPMADCNNNKRHQFKSIKTGGAEQASAAADVITSISTKRKRRTLAASKALSLDHHFVTQPAANGQSKLQLEQQHPGSTLHSAGKTDPRFEPVNDPINEQEGAGKGAGGRCLGRLVADHHSVYRLFHTRVLRLGGRGASEKDRFPSKQASLDGNRTINDEDDCLSAPRQAKYVLASNENHTNSSATSMELPNDDQNQCHVPFMAANSLQRATAADGEPNPRNRRLSGLGRSRFYWVKRFSVSSSSASMQTNCTNLPSDSSAATDSTFNCSSSNANGASATPGQVSPRPIIHCNSGDDSHRQRPLIGATKKCAHFSIDTANNSSPSPPMCSSSGCESSSSTYSTSKTPSPDPLFDQTPLRASHHHSVQANGSIQLCHDAISPKTKSNQYLLAKNSSLVEEVDEEEQSDPPGKRSTPANTDETSNLVAENCVTNQLADNDERMSAATSDAEEHANVTNGPEAGKPNNNASSLRAKNRLPIRKGKSLDQKARDTHHHHNFHFNLRRANTRCGTQSTICASHNSNNNNHHQTHNHSNGHPHLSELLVVQDLSKKQQMDSRRQVVVMLAFVVACFFLLFFPYRVFTIWLILSTEDQVQSLGMEAYYNLTYFSRILIYLHSAINPIAYNLISTKFRRAFMSILLCRGSSSRRHFVTEHRFIATNNKSMMHNHDSVQIDHKKQQLNHITSN